MKMTFTLVPLLVLTVLSACATAPMVNDADQYGLTSSNNSNTSAPSTSSPTSEMTNYDSFLPKDAQPEKGDTIAIMETEKGTIKLKLFTKDVPELSKNFAELAKAGKYDGAPFHRVMKNFMIQGGDFTNGNGTGGYSYKGPGKYLANEITKHKHLYGTFSMAKSSAEVSIGSQFFIINNKNGVPYLDGGYSPFGQVYEGMNVVQDITSLQVPGTEEPESIVKINKVMIEIAE